MEPRGHWSTGSGERSELFGVGRVRLGTCEEWSSVGQGEAGAGERGEAVSAGAGEGEGGNIE